MNFVRLYLIVQYTSGDLKVFVNRDLESLENAWIQVRAADPNCAALVHVGFIRPSNEDILPLLSKFPNRVLITESARWVLPDKYITFPRAAGVCKYYVNSGDLPVYLSLDGWGYTCSVQDIKLEILKEKSQSNPPIGWVKQISQDAPNYYFELVEREISDDDGYNAFRNELPEVMQKVIDSWRFNYLKNDIDNKYLWNILKIAPAWFLRMELSKLELTERLKNVFIRYDINVIADLQSCSYEKLMMFTNFGKKSYSDLVDILWNTIEEETYSVIDIANQGLPSSDKQDNFLQSKLITLRNLVDGVLENLEEREKKIIQGRFGYFNSRLTLEQIGEEFGLTRERVRQIESHLITKLGRTNNIKKELQARLFSILENRMEPVLLELLETEDVWFKGFEGVYDYLAGIIENLTEGKLHVVYISGRNIISRISQKDWDILVKEICALLQEDDLVGLDKNEINLILESILCKNKVPQLKCLLMDILKDKLVFAHIEKGKPESLIRNVKSIENFVLAILTESDSPLHKDDLARMIKEKYSRFITPQHAANSALTAGAMLFNRSTYGLMKHIPLEENEIKEIIGTIEGIVTKEDNNKQWHCQELCNLILVKHPEFSGVLNPYLMNLVLNQSESLISLGRLVWIKKNIKTKQCRIDIAKAFISILEDAGKPVNETILKQKLSEKRGINSNLQIQSNDQMIAILPGLWGLVDRDIPISKYECKNLLNILYTILKRRNKALHISELNQSLERDGFLVPKQLHPYTLLRLAQIDPRFKVGRGGLLGLENWKNLNRLSISQAVKKIICESPQILFSELYKKATKLVGRIITKQSVTSILQNLGATYNKENGYWEYIDRD